MKEEEESCEPIPARKMDNLGGHNRQDHHLGQSWKLPQARLSFLISAMYDTLPSPQNLHCWYGTEEFCQLCGHLSPSLQHILSGCKTEGEWDLRTDLGRQLKFPQQIVITSLRPDIVIWSTST
ncbi:uncharacterized protein LOC122133219 [Tachysurus ichikawai]